MEGGEPLKFVAIVGPTASGKSEVGIELSLRLGGEVVNYDSLQIYRYFNIGTAKVPPEERRGVPHHLLDIVDPDQEFNAHMYREMAEKVVRRTTEKGRIPILVGGTGFYLRALERGLFPQEEDIKPYREKAQEMMEEMGLEKAYNFLVSLDKRLSYIHPHDRVRIRRALEIYLMTGKSPAELWEEKKPKAKVLKIGLMPKREELRRRIEERVHEMVRKGFVEEVEFIASRFGPGIKPLRSIGYREMLLYIMGFISLEEAMRVTAKRTKMYAKRQMTWFRKEEVVWFEPPYPLEKMKETIERFWECSS